MTPSERSALTLALDSGLPYVGLRDLSPDPNLLLYLPTELARSGDVVPLSRADNVLELACTHPRVDLSALRSRFPRLQIEMCISPVDDVRTLLGTMSQGFR